VSEGQGCGTSLRGGLIQIEVGMGPSMADIGRGRCHVRAVARRRVRRSGCMSTRRGPRRDVTRRSRTVDAPSAKPGSASSGAPAHPPAMPAAVLPRCTGTLGHAIGGSVSPVARRGPGDQGVGRASSPPVNCAAWAAVMPLASAKRPSADASGLRPRPTCPRPRRARHRWPRGTPSEPRTGEGGPRRGSRGSARRGSPQPGRDPTPARR